MRRLTLLRVLAVLLGAAAPWAPALAEITGSRLIADGFTRPVFATHAPGDKDHLFVVEQPGVIKVIDLTSNTVQSTPFLDISNLVDDAQGEQGLLGLAFHPDYQSNGYFYVNYTRDPGPGNDRTRIDRFQVANPATELVAAASTRNSVLEFEQDFPNHNGGWIGFSPSDNYLYIATGDGGSGNDPNGRGQSLSTRLGKMLRVDVNGDAFPADATENYAVPADNPFVDGSPGTLDEIWAYGLRNPYRSSFDRKTGDLWIGDVGQGAQEEINFQPASSPGGENYGWRSFEGFRDTGLSPNLDPEDVVFPVLDYPRSQGQSVTGGYAYRGPDPDIRGDYYFADFVASNIFLRDPDDAIDVYSIVNSTFTPNVSSIGNISSFGEDWDGNLYIVDYGGEVFRADAFSELTGDFDGNDSVEQADFDVWLANYGATGPNVADANGDLVVDALDYALWRENAGRSLPSSGNGGGDGGGFTPAQAPEPSAITCLLLTGVLLGRRMRYADR